MQQNKFIRKPQVHYSLQEASLTRQPQRSQSFNDFFQSNKVPVTYTPHRTGTFTVDIYGYIEEPSQFSEMVTALELMEAEDEMIVNLQSNGGCASTTDTVLHALRKTKGKVHFVATGQNASAATIILLEAQSFELSENFSALIHCGGLGDGGTLSEFRQSSPHHIKMMERLIRETYAGFMSEKEIESMLDGKDFWLDAQEWCDRYEKRNTWLQEQMQKEMEEVSKTIKPAKKPRNKKASSEGSAEESMFMQHKDEGVEFTKK